MTFTQYPNLCAADRFVLASVWVRLNVDHEPEEDVLAWARTQMKSKARSTKRIAAIVPLISVTRHSPIAA